MSVSANLLSEVQEEHQTMQDPLKRDRRDFALWKRAKSNEPAWSSPWGKGRPGWHIECSAMASKIFGSQIDIHSGGYDLLFPHHTNEKSQSEAYHGCSQWVNYWLHSGLLQVETDVKMSKSIKNTISIKQFLQDNSVNDFRILCLQSSYRKNISYGNDTLTGAQSLHKKFHNFINEAEAYITGELRLSLLDQDELLLKLKKTKEDIIAVLSDDFNTSMVLLYLSDFIDEVNKQMTSPVATVTTRVNTIASISHYVDSVLELFGVKIVCKKRLNNEFVQIIDALKDFRNEIRLLALCLIKDEKSVSAFIDNVYHSFHKKTLMNTHVEELTPKLQQILSETNLFYKKCSDFSISLLETEAPNKKQRVQLLIYCDELRSVLEKYGIAIKDRRDISTWLPLQSLEV